MSVESVALALNHSRATGSAKLVLIGIANHDGDGGSWPSVSTLARYAGISERNVQKQIATLIELGEIERHVNDGGTHRTPQHMRPNLYRILLKCPPDCDGSTRHHRASEATPPVASDTPPLSQATPPPLSQATPEPSVEPEEESSSRSRAKRATRSTTFPASFAVDEQMVLWARINAPNVSIQKETSTFEDWHRAKGSTFKDWKAAWRTWMRRANERNDVRPFVAPAVKPRIEQPAFIDPNTWE